MNNDFKEIFDNISVSSKLDKVIKDSIIRAKTQKKKSFIRGVSFKFVTGVATITILFTVGINSSVSFASTVKNVPIVSSIAQALQFNYDKNIVSAVNQGDSQKVNQTVSNNNVSLTINSVVGDNKDKFILYTLKSNNKNIKNLLLNNFTISNESDNVLVDSTRYRFALPPILINKSGDFLALNSAKGYKCIVSSLGDTISNYASNGETYGSIELISLDNKSIPNNLKLKVSNFTEVYNMDYLGYSQKKYADFLAKFNRKPIDINGNWQLDVNNISKNKTIETYNNIKFNANNTDFQINYFKIYPTHMDANIKLGVNKIDNSTAVGFGRPSTTHQDNFTSLPYLIDENGSKYMLSPGAFTSQVNADKSINLTFQSSYYTKIKHLYLVIGQINYEPGKPYTDITPVKVQIK